MGFFLYHRPLPACPVLYALSASTHTSPLPDLAPVMGSQRHTVFLLPLSTSQKRTRFHASGHRANGAGT